MSKHTLFTEDEFPHHILARFGFTREMLEDLPAGIVDCLSAGQITPRLPIKIKTDDGRTIESAACISLYRLGDEEVRVMFYPKFEKVDLSRFDADQQKMLNDGYPIIDTLTLPNGETTKGYYQIDEDINQVVATPVAVVENNINQITSILKLTDAERNCLINGKLLTVTEYDAQITIGVNLTEGTGIRLVDGDSENWLRKERRDYDKYNFGLNGCWAMNDEGGFEYIPEEEYTDELWNELKNRGNQSRGNVASFRM